MAVAAPGGRLDQAEALRLLREDTPLYAETCLKIVDKGGRLVPLKPKPAQLKFDAAMERQRAAGKPIRILLPKARQWGGSTWTAAKVIQRVTQMPNRKALVMAHQTKAAENLFGMYEAMYAHLPDEEGLGLKPTIANARRQQLLYFANPSRLARQQGDTGLNSFVMAATAGDAGLADGGGRSFTYHDLHGSECAFWKDLKLNLTALLQTVPNDPGTMIVLESTANGMNHWHTLCRQAEEGESDFELVFIPWFEEPGYQRFLTPEEKAEFVVGEGPGPTEWYEDEPVLAEQHGVSLEQLAWRRWAIINLCQSDLRILHQEYPSTLEESFLATGKQVFSVAFVKRMLGECLPPVARGSFEASGSVTRKVPGGTVEVPTGARWVEKPHGEWLIWEWPDDGRESKVPGQYIVAADVADESEVESDENAWHVGQVMNHRTKMQCAEYRSQVDSDLLARQLYLAALFYGVAHRPWIAPETQGGYGVTVAVILWQRFRYPFVYQSKVKGSKKDRQQDRLGWKTTGESKPLMIDGLKEGLREGDHGVRSSGLAREHLTYVRNERGRMKPEPGEFADRLMAWAIARQVAQEKPLRPDRVAGRVVAAVRERGNPITGYSAGG